MAFTPQEDARIELARIARIKSRARAIPNRVALSQGADVRSAVTAASWETTTTLIREGAMWKSGSLVRSRGGYAVLGAKARVGRSYGAERRGPLAPNFVP